MTNFVTGIIGIAMLCVFLGIMLWWIKALPLMVIFGLAIVLVIVDFAGTLRASNGNDAKS